MEEVDFAGIYVPKAAENEYQLVTHHGFPQDLMESCSSLSEIPGKTDSEKCGIPAGGWFSLSFDSHPGIHLFVSPVPGSFNEDSEMKVLWLASVVGANLRRIRAVKTFMGNLEEMSLLLDRIVDPVFSTDHLLNLNYCNAVFRRLVRLEEQDVTNLTLKQVMGRELSSMMLPELEKSLESGQSSNVFCSFMDRTFSTSIHPFGQGLLVIMNDRTEVESKSNELSFSRKFQNLLVNIATDFIEMQGTALNLGIHDALLSIGVALGVERAYLFQFRHGLDEMANTHEWCASNIQPMIDEMQDLSTSDFPWLMNRFGLHETLRIDSISDIPEWAESERDLFQRKNIQSLVAVPIVHGNELKGFLGFDSVNAKLQWSEHIIDLLRIVGDAIGNALERNRLEKRMMEMYHRAEKDAQINAVLLREVNHRVKNNLSEIIGLLYAQRRFASGDYDDFILDLIGRIRGLATAHDMLSRSGWNPLELTVLAKAIVSSAVSNAPGKKRIRTSVSRSSITVDSNQAHALALILNELVRNSVKHALKDTDSLTIKVRMRKDRSERVNITYSDDGPGYPSEVLRLKRKNLGIDLIENLTVKNLQGDLTLQDDGGAVTRIGFSIAQSEEREDEED